MLSRVKPLPCASRRQDYPHASAARVGATVNHERAHALGRASRRAQGAIPGSGPGDAPGARADSISFGPYRIFPAARAFEEESRIIDDMGSLVAKRLVSPNVMRSTSHRSWVVSRPAMQPSSANTWETCALRSTGPSETTAQAATEALAITATWTRRNEAAERIFLRSLAEAPMRPGVGAAHGDVARPAAHAPATRRRGPAAAAAVEPGPSRLAIETDAFASFFNSPLIPSRSAATGRPGCRHHP